jgi:DNA-binding transcriptional LysR family regulator
MELRHLRYFVLVAEELHFSRAAERAGIAQPPLSQQIRSLESELGVRLFHRTRRKVELTDAGKELLPMAQRLLRDAAIAERTARLAASGAFGIVEIGFVGSLAFKTLPRIVQQIRGSLPNVHLDLRELTSQQQREALLDRHISLGLARFPLDDSGLKSVLLTREPLAVASFRKLSEGPLRVMDIANEPLIMFPRGFGPELHDQIMALFAECDVSPCIEQEAVQMSTILGLVSAGIGSAIVPDSMVALRLEGVRFHVLFDSWGRRPEAGVYLVHRKSDQSEVLHRVIRLITDQPLV